MVADLFHVLCFSLYLSRYIFSRKCHQLQAAMDGKRHTVDGWVDGKSFGFREWSRSGYWDASSLIYWCKFQEDKNRTHWGMLAQELRGLFIALRFFFTWFLHGLLYIAYYTSGKFIHSIMRDWWRVTEEEADNQAHVYVGVGLGNYQLTGGSWSSTPYTY